MNREAVFLLVKDKLQDVIFLQDANILFGKYCYNQSTIGTYFIDYGDNDINVDLREYQEKYISSEYFKIPGYYQWNYYLIFLRESYKEEDKLLIEKDNIFTRKFVFTPDDLAKYFDYKKSNKSVDADIVNVWKEKLKAVDLDEVYSQSPYTQAVPRYLNNEVIKDIEVDQQYTGPHRGLTIKNISNLILKNDYRQYPKLTRDFIFGRVNLITGVNGTGKTSVLESIELIITGKSNRDPSFNEENNCIEVTYNDDSSLKDRYTPGDNAKYRERDIAWYSSAYKTGNELYRSFNKYNFYDSDAAYNLAYNSDIGSLSKYFSSIALGPEFNLIQNRLNGFKERLSKENSNRKRIIEEEMDRKINAELTLESIKATSDPEVYFKSFISYAKEIEWNKQLPIKFDETYTDFEENYQTALSYINSLNQLSATIKLRNVHSWAEELNKIEKALDDCNKNNIQIVAINKTIAEKNEILANAYLKFQVLVSAKKFFEDQSSFKLWGLDEKINTLSSEIKKAIRVIEQTENISDKNIFNNSSTLISYKKELLNKKAFLQEKQKQLGTQIENLKVNLDSLQVIVSEIKSSGKQYISLNRNADTCPLCETKYPYNELSNRISQIAQNIKENIAIAELNNQLLALNEELMILNSLIKDVELVEMAVSNIDNDSNYLQLSFIEINNLIVALKSKLSQDTSEYSEFLKLKQVFTDKELYEEDFNRTKEKFENNFPDIQFTVDHKDQYERINIEIKKVISDLESLLKTEKDILLDLENNQKLIILAVAPGINYLSFDSELKYRIEILTKGISYYAKLKEYLSYSEVEDISDIDQKVNKLIQLYEEIKKSISDQKEFQLANHIILEAEKIIKSLQPECKRLDEGLKTINDILDNHNESTVLSNFMESNVKEIQEIFQNIHTPNEFSKIAFSPESNTVLLKRRIDAVEVPIHKISSGQRSALALSIFIALNKQLKQGPYLILFDDPVTYTDDLNILSFLDYLRMLVIHEHKQLFFATANQKLAGLFEKKFSFLGNTDFKIFPLER